MRRIRQATRKVVKNDVTITVTVKGPVRPGVTDTDAKETISTAAAFFANLYAGEWDKITQIVQEEAANA